MQRIHRPTVRCRSTAAELKSPPPDDHASHRRTQAKSKIMPANSIVRSATPEERAAALWFFAYFFTLLAGYYVLRPLCASSQRSKGRGFASSTTIAAAGSAFGSSAS